VGDDGAELGGAHAGELVIFLFSLIKTGFSLNNR
jgi:hypothetical protein